jgi:hypothetical protein
MRRFVHRLQNWSVALGLITALLLGGALGGSTLAQTAGQNQDPSFFPATGYQITSPEILAYFQHHGGARTFGYPVSSEFPLLGQRVQIFQREVIGLNPDGTVAPLNILQPDALPIQKIDGLTLPAADPDLVSSAPTPDSPDYQAQALSFVSAFVPDEWNGLPVNFQTTFANTVACPDTGDAACDASTLQAMALDVWGLPTSQPTSDPTNPDFVYQRFQRGIMHFSNAAGTTQGLLVGDWMKRVLLGVDLPADLGSDIRRSRFYAQYAPSRPLALDRPADLPNTSLAQAFHADSLTVAQSTTQTPTLPPGVAETATSVAMTSTSLVGTQAALQGTQTGLTATALAFTATASVAVAAPTQAAVPATSTIPVVNVGCLGDEQLWFVPRRPNVGTHVQISVTSQRHHDVRFLVLAGPLDPGPVTERVGPLGFIWTWTVVPQVEDFHQWTFYADGLRPCNTSGFNAYAPLGATATPTQTPIPTNTPGTATATPTNTAVPQPRLDSVNPPSGACGALVTINGNNFGSPPTAFGTRALLSGPESSTHEFIINGGSNTQMSAQVPTTGLVADTAATTHTVQVVNQGGVSQTLPFRVTTTCNT